MNSFLKKCEITSPIWQAPMAGHQDARMAIAVTQAGGLGALATATFTPTQLLEQLTRLKQYIGQQFNLNFFVHHMPDVDELAQSQWRETLAPHYQAAGISPAVTAGASRAPFNEELAELVAPFAPKVVSFHFGLPAPTLLERVKSWGSLVVSSATTVAEAIYLEAHGVDAVIAQGLEAGGHRGHFLNHELSLQMGTFALLPQIVAAVRCPVIAAGGIAHRQGVEAALKLGASAVQIGTAFLLCDESLASPLHQAALKSDAAKHTALTNIFTGRPARGIVNRGMQALAYLSPHAPAFPLATSAIAPLRTHYENLGQTDFTPLWAGQNASGSLKIGAQDLVKMITPVQ